MKDERKWIIQGLDESQTLCKWTRYGSWEEVRVQILKIINANDLAKCNKILYIKHPSNLNSLYILN